MITEYFKTPCGEILNKGKELTLEEFELLTDHFPRTDGYEYIEFGKRRYRSFYLEGYGGPMGFATIYLGTVFFSDDWPGEVNFEAFYCNQDRAKMNLALKERVYAFDRFGVSNIAYINDIQRKLAFPKDGVLVFHDLSGWKTFSTYKELEQDYFEYGAPDYLQNPLRDPEFKAIYDRGTLLDLEDYNVFLSHCMYIDYDHPTRKDGYVYYDNVVPLSDGASLSIKMRRWDRLQYHNLYEDDDYPFLEVVDCPHFGGFKCICRGKVVKDYEEDESPVGSRYGTSYSVKQCGYIGNAWNKTRPQK